MSFHVRRRDREITDSDKLMEVLKSTKYATIALCKDNEPYLVSLSHGYDEAANCLYFHCADEGKKLVYIKANSKVWRKAVLDYGVTDECDYTYTCVHFKGNISLIQDLDEKRHAMEVMVKQLSENPAEKLAKIKPEKFVKATMGRIEISCMTGKKHQHPET
jgi:nitroimidazol reductase NimA-like FMN-containing flavoprotein (pyridoxamine 5'-phosphate oxidase superfamily)